jgi:hypothetical protein
VAAHPNEFIRKPPLTEAFFILKGIANRVSANIIHCIASPWLKDKTTKIFTLNYLL